jgi:hypothetical protein
LAYSRRYLSSRPMRSSLGIFWSFTIFSDLPEDCRKSTKGKFEMRSTMNHEWKYLRATRFGSMTTSPFTTMPVRNVMTISVQQGDTRGEA